MKLRAIMLDDILKTPQEIRLGIAAKAQAKRLALNMSQKDLAARSGVSLGSVKRFETTGEISLASLLAIALILNDLEAFSGLFNPPRTENLFKPQSPALRKRAGENAMNLDVHLHAYGVRRHVGKLAAHSNAILFQYTPEFLDLGINISPFRLPLSPEVREDPKRTFDGLFGVFNDSLPDGWGLLLLDRALRKKAHRSMPACPCSALPWWVPTAWARWSTPRRRNRQKKPFCGGTGCSGRGIAADSARCACGCGATGQAYSAQRLIRRGQTQNSGERCR